MYKIRILENKEVWNKFLDEIQPQTFLQDFEWGEVEKLLGKEVIRIGIFFDENNLIGVCQIIRHKARRGNFLLIPHLTILKNSETELPNILVEIIKFLKSQHSHKKYSFLRLNSSFLHNEKLQNDLQKVGFRIAPIWTVSENMWVKNLRKSDEELLNEMNPTHKKLIVESFQKPYLEIKPTADISKINEFWKIYKELAKRKEFAPYSYELIKNEFEIFSQEGKAKMYFGKVEGKIVSAAMIIYSHNIAFYHHGASLPIKEPINYKMHWQIIQDAKKMGCEYYNMWGITLRGNVNHPWWGLTQFKKGFGGELIQFLPAMDYPFSKKYWLNYAIEKFRRKIKRL